MIKSFHIIEQEKHESLVNINMKSINEKEKKRKKNVKTKEEKKWRLAQNEKGNWLVKLY